MKPSPTLEELSAIFKEGFEQIYKEYYANKPEVIQLLEMTPRFKEEYFFNNGIKYLMGKLKELSEIQAEEAKICCTCRVPLKYCGCEHDSKI